MSKNIFLSLLFSASLPVSFSLAMEIPEEYMQVINISKSIKHNFLLTENYLPDLLIQGWIDNNANFLLKEQKLNFKIQKLTDDINNLDILQNYILTHKELSAPFGEFINHINVEDPNDSIKEFKRKYCKSLITNKEEIIKILKEAPEKIKQDETSKGISFKEYLEILRQEVLRGGKEKTKNVLAILYMIVMEYGTGKSINMPEIEHLLPNNCAGKPFPVKYLPKLSKYSLLSIRKAFQQLKKELESELLKSKEKLILAREESKKNFLTPLELKELEKIWFEEIKSSPLDQMRDVSSKKEEELAASFIVRWLKTPYDEMLTIDVETVNALKSLGLSKILVIFNDSYTLFFKGNGYSTNLSPTNAGLYEKITFRYCLKDLFPLPQNTQTSFQKKHNEILETFRNLKRQIEWPSKRKAKSTKTLLPISSVHQKETSALKGKAVNKIIKEKDLSIRYGSIQHNHNFPHGIIYYDLLPLNFNFSNLYLELLSNIKSEECSLYSFKSNQSIFEAGSLVSGIPGNVLKWMRILQVAILKATPDHPRNRIWCSLRQESSKNGENLNDIDSIDTHKINQDSYLSFKEMMGIINGNINKDQSRFFPFTLIFQDELIPSDSSPTPQFSSHNYSIPQLQQQAKSFLQELNKEENKKKNSEYISQLETIIHHLKLQHSINEIGKEVNKVYLDVQKILISEFSVSGLSQSDWENALKAKRSSYLRKIDLLNRVFASFKKENTDSKIIKDQLTFWGLMNEISFLRLMCLETISEKKKGDVEDKIQELTIHLNQLAKEYNIKNINSLFYLDLSKYIEKPVEQILHSIQEKANLPLPKNDSFLSFFEQYDDLRECSPFVIINEYPMSDKEKSEFLHVLNQCFDAEYHKTVPECFKLVKKLYLSKGRVWKMKLISRPSAFFIHYPEYMFYARNSKLPCDLQKNKFLQACDRTNPQELKLILQEYKYHLPNVNQYIDSTGRPLLVSVFMKDLFPIAWELLNLEGLNVNAFDPSTGNSALHIACAKFKVPLIEKLIEKKADVNQLNFFWRSPLYYAYHYGKHLDNDSQSEPFIYLFPKQDIESKIEGIIKQFSSKNQEVKKKRNKEQLKEMRSHVAQLLLKAGAHFPGKISLSPSTTASIEETWSYQNKDYVTFIESHNRWQTPLHDACTLLDFNKINNLLKQEAISRLNTHNLIFESPLFCFLKALTNVNNEEREKIKIQALITLNYLLVSGATLNGTPNYNGTSIENCYPLAPYPVVKQKDDNLSRRSYLEELWRDLDLLILKFEDYRKTGETPLHTACNELNYDDVVKYTQTDKFVNQLNNNKESPLHILFKYFYVSFNNQVANLINVISKVDKNKNSVLEKFCQFIQFNPSKSLIDVTPEEFAQALHQYIVKTGIHSNDEILEVVEQFEEKLKGAENLNCGLLYQLLPYVNNQGKHPSQVKVQGIKIIKHLLSLGATLNGTSKWEIYPFKRFFGDIKADNEKSRSYLNGIWNNRQKIYLDSIKALQHGNTPLHTACSQLDLESVQELLKKNGQYTDCKYDGEEKQTTIVESLSLMHQVEKLFKIIPKWNEGSLKTISIFSSLILPNKARVGIQLMTLRLALKKYCDKNNIHGWGGQDHIEKVLATIVKMEEDSIEKFGAHEERISILQDIITQWDAHDPKIKDYFQEHMKQRYRQPNTDYLAKPFKAHIFGYSLKDGNEDQVYEELKQFIEFLSKKTGKNSEKLFGKKFNPFEVYNTKIQILKKGNQGLKYNPLEAYQDLLSYKDHYRTYVTVVNKDLHTPLMCVLAYFYNLKEPITESDKNKALQIMRLLLKAQYSETVEDSAKRLWDERKVVYEKCIEKTKLMHQSSVIPSIDKSMKLSHNIDLVVPKLGKWLKFADYLPNKKNENEPKKILLFYSNVSSSSSSIHEHLRYVQHEKECMQKLSQKIAENDNWKTYVQLDVVETEKQFLNLLSKNQYWTIILNGHGTPNDFFVVNESLSESHPMPFGKMQNILKRYKQDLSCILTTSCSSNALETMSNHSHNFVPSIGDYYIGSTKTITDSEGTLYLYSFLKGLFKGEPVPKVYYSLKSDKPYMAMFWTKNFPQRENVLYKN